jgi:Flp pilus assembly protein TadG
MPTSTRKAMTMDARFTPDKPISSGVMQTLARFRADSRGLATVEFAFLLPIMLVLYLGVVEVTQGIIAKRKVDVLTRTLTDLTSQESQISDTYINNVFATTTPVLAPLSGTPSKMRVTSLVLQGPGGGNPAFKVCQEWSKDGPNGAPTAAVPSAATIPASLFDPNLSIAQPLVVGQTEYAYKPILTQTLFTPLGTGVDLTAKPVFMRPRVASPSLLYEVGGVVQPSRCKNYPTNFS